MHKFRIVCLIAILAMSAVSAFAWDDVGHKIIAYIAWQQMTPQAREKAFKILMAAPEDSQLSTFYIGDSRPDQIKQLELFMTASYWPDIVRDKKFPVRSQKYHHGSWHYKDNFWREVNGTVEAVTTIPVAPENSIERLGYFDVLLRDPAKTDAEKAIAIAWVLHLVGDTHQPLHCTSRVTDLEPKGDQGGNFFLLEPKDPNKPLTENIHWYWDSIIRKADPRVGSEETCEDSYLFKLAKKIMKKYPAAKFQAGMKPGQFEEWRLEGAAIATKEVYAGLEREKMPSPKYLKHAYEVAKPRVALAGYRLGAMLNQTLGQ